MNRPIEFRCFAFGKMYFAKDCFALSPDGEYWQFADQGYFCNNSTVQEFILMQFTGLLDKKGVKIFENDIVKTKTCLGEGISQIIWDNNSCCFTSKNLGSHIMDKETEFEVLGNVFQNLELLESVH